MVLRLAFQHTSWLVRHIGGSGVTLRTARELVLKEKQNVAWLVLATALLRLPFLTPRLAHWDAVNYALGLHDFNIAAHQPHPPGSPYFILLGRASLALVGDDNTALILISVIASAGAVVAEYVLARLLFGPRAALLAALVLMTQPFFWGYGVMADAWTLLAFLSVGIGLLCALMARRNGYLVLPSAAAMAVASGFRLDVTVFLAPLWFWALWRAESDGRRRLAAMALVLAGVLVWLVPVAAGGGGAEAWSDRLLALLPSPELAPETRIRQLEANTFIALGTLLLTVGPSLAVSLLCDARRTWSWLGDQLHGGCAVLWVLWIVPSFGFLWVVDSTEPGHDLLFIGALVALVSGLVVATARSIRRIVLSGGIVLALQVGVFLFAPPLDGRPLAWTADTMLLNITAPGLRQQQSSLDSALRLVRAGFRPDDTVIITLVGQDPYRFFMYYLPEYSVLRLDTHAGTVLAARGHRQGNWTLPTDCLFSSVIEGPEPIRHAVWIVGTRSEPGVIPEEATRIDPPDEVGPFQVWNVEVGPTTADYLGFKLGGQCALSPGSAAGQEW